MAKLRKIKSKAKSAEETKPAAENPAAAPLQALTSSSTPASIKKKIKKKEKMTKMKSEIPDTEIAVAEEANAPAEAPSKVPTEDPAKLPTDSPAKLPTEDPVKLPTESPAKLPTEAPENAQTEAPANAVNEAPENADKSSGFIFMCNSRTKPECFRHQVFGLPRGKAELVHRIKPGTRLFLYDIDLRLLYGIYRAVSAGGINLALEAFGGAFPAQVIFKVDKDCIPLPERSFKQAILENYGEKNRFEQNLTSKQVDSLVLLFQPVSNVPPQTAALQYTENRHLPVHLPPPADPFRYPPHAHMPPPKDQYISAGQVAASHLPPPEDPYWVAGHMAHPHFPLPEDPYRSVGHVAASYLHPAVAYRSGSYPMHHQMPPEYPYGHNAYLPRVPIDPRYLSPFAPPPANDPRAPQHLLGAPPPTGPYYPAPASHPYGQVDAGRAYYHEDSFAYRMMAPGTHAATDPSLQQRYYMENIRRQATAAPTGPVSSHYPFAGAAPAHP